MLRCIYRLSNINHISQQTKETFSKIICQRQSKTNYQIATCINYVRLTLSSDESIENIFLKSLFLWTMILLYPYCEGFQQLTVCKKTKRMSEAIASNHFLPTVFACFRRGIDRKLCNISMRTCKTLIIM